MDVDAGEFRQLVQNVQYLCRAVTVYVSESDIALEASRRVHGGQYRAGDARANLDITGVSVIRVSAPGMKDPLGHSYYGSHPKVLDQLHRLTRPTELLSQGNPQPVGLH